MDNFDIEEAPKEHTIKVEINDAVEELMMKKPCQLLKKKNM